MNDGIPTMKIASMLYTGAAAAVATAVTAGPALAEVNNFGNDYTALTGKVDSGEIAKAVVTVGGLMVAPRLAKTGVRWVRSVIN